MTTPTGGKSTRRQAITAVRRAINWGFEEGHLTEFPIGLRKLGRPKMGKRETLVSEEDHERMRAWHRWAALPGVFLNNSLVPSPPI